MDNNQDQHIIDMILLTKKLKQVLTTDFNTNNVHLKQILELEIKDLKQILLVVEKKFINNNSCSHEYRKQIPSGPRDNNEHYYVCIHCNQQK